jgi:hypothetical protein
MPSNAMCPTPPPGEVAPGRPHGVPAQSQKSAIRYTSSGMCMKSRRCDNTTAKRHTHRATRVAQCVELSQQLIRGAAVDQVDDAHAALVHNHRGPTAEPAAMIVEGPVTYGG